MKLEHIAEGKLYRSTDPKTGFLVTAKKGTVVEVSEEKGAQMLADFPKDFKKAGPDAKVTDPVQVRVASPMGAPRAARPVPGSGKPVPKATAAPAPAAPSAPPAAPPAPAAVEGKPPKEDGKAK